MGRSDKRHNLESKNLEMAVVTMVSSIFTVIISLRSAYSPNTFFQTCNRILVSRSIRKSYSIFNSTFRESNAPWLVDHSHIKTPTAKHYCASTIPCARKSHCRRALKQRFLFKFGSAAKHLFKTLFKCVEVYLAMLGRLAWTIRLILPENCQSSTQHLSWKSTLIFFINHRLWGSAFVPVLLRRNKIAPGRKTKALFNRYFQLSKVFSCPFYYMRSSKGLMWRTYVSSAFVQFGQWTVISPAALWDNRAAMFECYRRGHKE